MKRQCSIGWVPSLLLVSILLQLGACSIRQRPVLHEEEFERGEQGRAVSVPATEVLDAASVRRVVEAGEHRVQACFQEWLDSLVEDERVDVDVRFAGRVLIAFEVGEDGDVSELEILRSDFGGAAFEPCVLSEVGRWVFPRPAPEDVPVGVEIPFFFEPRVE